MPLQTTLSAMRRATRRGTRHAPLHTGRSPTTPRGSVRAPVLLLVLFAFACGDSPTDTAPEEITSLPRQLSVSEEEIIESSNGFAFHLAERVSAPDSNFFVSPLSASMALGMTLNGARGETFDQMRSVLGFDGLAQDEINASYRSLIELLVSLDPTVETAVGNSVWYREGFEVRQAFLDTVREHFDARIEALDFSDPGAAEVINGWVREATRDRIESIVPDPVPASVVMYLINAIYFLGDWTWQFDPELTADADFHRPDGTTVTVPLMERHFEQIAHHRGSDFEAVDLPYGGQAFSMTVLLPDDGVDLEGWIAELDAERWAGISAALEGSERTLDVYLPKFEMEYERTLNDDLKALGMTDAFDPGLADLTGIREGGGIWIDEVKQKAYVRVDERGTEAAAVTSVTVVESLPPSFRADRPFVFVLRERLSGTILFMGKVVDPSG